MLFVLVIVFFLCVVPVFLVFWYLPNIIKALAAAKNLVVDVFVSIPLVRKFKRAMRFIGRVSKHAGKTRSEQSQMSVPHANAAATVMPVSTPYTIHEMETIPAYVRKGLILLV